MDAVDRPVTSAPLQFSACRFDATGVRRIADHYRLGPKARFQLAEALNRLNDAALRRHGGLATLVTGKPDNDLIRALSDYFTGLVDDRLQELYRRCLADNPPPVGASHDRRIALLDRVAAAAFQLVADVDWEWLADWLGFHPVDDGVRRLLWRLSNRAFPVTRLNLRFTKHCNFECAHCYNSSGSSRKHERLPLVEMLAIVEQMPDLDLTELILTGGEPFLYPDDVIAVIEKARSIGVPGIALLTNAWWAVDRRRAQTMLDRLAAAGFMTGPGDSLKASGGIHHQPFMAFDPIVDLARMFFNTFGRRMIIDYEVDDEQSFQSKTAEFKAAGLDAVAQIHVRRVIAIGRGSTLKVEPHPAPSDKSCSAVGTIVVYDPDGAMRPCCGMNADNSGIRFAQHPDHDVATAVRRMQNDPILQALYSRPVASLLSCRGEQAGAENSLCQLCQRAVGGLEDREPMLAELFRQQRFYPFDFRAVHR